ncbi:MULTISPECIES: histidine phosphatase family protein [Exiguobacterium]|uniref:histidine phosphatase family protein n=1 Tax=Exiguobacterium TaxID=33986 RepID=UPI0007D7834F|nr:MULTISPECIES: histidine phosphatase family protein [Exiguobacterium]OAI83978.1 phosphoglycerate mutase [Exiguobacterium sp. KKBO11]
MTEICLVRHGQTDWNLNERIQGREDIPLNATGRRQAELSAAYLSNEEWDVLLASPLSRAVETAEIIGRAVGLTITATDERLVEREFGAASGEPVAAIYEAVQANDTTLVPGLETEQAIQDRVFEALQEVTRMYEGKRILIVCHSHTIKAALSSIDETFSYRTPLKNACANYIQHTDHYTIDRINVADHITDEVEKP